MKRSAPTPSKTRRALALLGIAAASSLWAASPAWATAPAIQGAMPAEARCGACSSCLTVAQTASEIDTSDTDTHGLTREGMDTEFDQNDIDTQGLDTEGMTREGMDTDYDQSDIDTQGLDTQGMDQTGMWPAKTDEASSNAE